MFTLLQALGLGILWGVKSSAAALAFPFFVVAMIPFRWALKFLFTPVELEALDGPSAGQSYEKDEEEMDFYETANAVFSKYDKCDESCEGVILKSINSIEDFSSVNGKPFTISNHMNVK